MNKDQISRIDQLFREVAEKGMSRRQMIQRASVLGISASALTVAFMEKAQMAVAQGDDNPLGVAPDAPLSVVIFAGGYGDAYAVNVNENLYGQLYPNAQIEYATTQRPVDEYQARIVDGNPPDIMDNSGAGMFDLVTLYNDGLLADLTDLMEAPAYGQDGVTFGESLIPGTQDGGNYDGKQYVLYYVLGIYGIWYNQAKFEEKGWEYPKNWDEMLALCETIKEDGEMYPFTYQGMYPYYIRAVFDQLVFKSGGWDAQLKLDNIQEDAWTQPVVKQALDAMVQLYTNDYILPGTEGLSHTESQTAWVNGEAAMIPCGAWLENEVGVDNFPEGFEMVVAPVPSLTADDALPFEAIQSAGDENFIVFADGANVQGGKEWIRLLFSQEGAAFFSEATKSLTVVQGAGAGLDLGTAFQSAQEVVAAAGMNTFISRWPTYYPDLDEACQLGIAEVMTAAKPVDEFIAEMQEMTDQVREDESIPKFEVTAPTGTEATPAS